MALKNLIWRKHDRKVLGKPLHPPDPETGHDDGEPAVKVCGQRCYDVKNKC
jgi:hypothetical protein